MFRFLPKVPNSSDEAKAEPSHSVHVTLQSKGVSHPVYPFFCSLFHGLLRCDEFCHDFTVGCWLHNKKNFRATVRISPHRIGYYRCCLICCIFTVSFQFIFSTKIDALGILNTFPAGREIISCESIKIVSPADIGKGLSCL
jgi:hypothetical protein